MVAVVFVLMAEPLAGPVQYALLIGQPKPMVISGPVVMPLMMELVVIAGQVICISGWWSRWRSQGRWLCFS